MDKRIVYIGHSYKGGVYLGLLDICNLEARRVKVKEVSIEEYERLEENGVRVLFNGRTRYVHENTKVAIISVRSYRYDYSDVLPNSYISAKPSKKQVQINYYLTPDGKFYGVYEDTDLEGVVSTRDKLEYTEKDYKIGGEPDEELVSEILKDIKCKPKSLKDIRKYKKYIEQLMLFYGVTLGYVRDNTRTTKETLWYLHTISEGVEVVKIPELELHKNTEYVQVGGSSRGVRFEIGRLKCVGGSLKLRDIGVRRIELGEVTSLTLNNVERLGSEYEFLVCTDEGYSADAKFQLGFGRGHIMTEAMLDSLSKLNYKHVMLDDIRGLRAPGDLRYGSRLVVNGTIEGVDIGGDLDIYTDVGRISLVKFTGNNVTLRNYNKAADMPKADQNEKTEFSMRDMLSVKLEDVDIRGDISIEGHSVLDLDKAEGLKGFNIAGELRLCESVRSISGNFWDIEEYEIVDSGSNTGDSMHIGIVSDKLSLTVRSDNVQFSNVRLKELVWETSVKEITSYVYKYAESHHINKVESVESILWCGYHNVNMELIDFRVYPNLRRIYPQGIYGSRTLKVLVFGDNIRFEGEAVVDCEHLLRVYLGRNVSGVDGSTFKNTWGNLDIYTLEMTPELEELGKLPKYNVVEVNWEEWETIDVDSVVTPEEVRDFRPLLELEDTVVTGYTELSERLVEDIRVSCIVTGYSEELGDKYPIEYKQKESLGETPWVDVGEEGYGYSGDSLRDRVLLSLILSKYKYSEYVVKHDYGCDYSKVDSYYSLCGHRILGKELVDGIKGYIVINEVGGVVQGFSVEVQYDELRSIVEGYLAKVPGGDPSSIMRYAEVANIRSNVKGVTDTIDLKHTIYEYTKLDLPRDMPKSVYESTQDTWLPFGTFNVAGNPEMLGIYGIDLHTGDVVMYPSVTKKRGITQGEGAIWGLDLTLLRGKFYAGDLTKLGSKYVGRRDKDLKKIAEESKSVERVEEIDRGGIWLASNSEGREVLESMVYDGSCGIGRLSKPLRELKNICLKSGLYVEIDRENNEMYKKYFKATPGWGTRRIEISDYPHVVWCKWYNKSSSLVYQKAGDILEGVWVFKALGKVLQGISNSDEMASILSIIEGRVEEGVAEVSEEEYREASVIEEKGFRKLDLVLLRSMSDKPEKEVFSSGLSELKLSYSSASKKVCLHTDKYGVDGKYEGSLVYFWFTDLSKVWEVLDELGLGIREGTRRGSRVKREARLGSFCNKEGEVVYDEGVVSSELSELGEVVEVDRVEIREKRKKVIEVLKSTRKAILEGNKSKYTVEEEGYSPEIFEGVCKQPKSYK